MSRPPNFVSVAVRLSVQYIKAVTYSALLI